MKNPLRDKARTLRNNPTDAEAVLWSRLKSRQVEGVKFRRQAPLLGFIVDFVSFEKGIVIEVDGGQHALEESKDRVRDRRLEEGGFTVLRFWNNEVLGNLDEVVEAIRAACLA